MTSTTRSASSTSGANSFSRTHIDRVAGLYVTGDGGTGSGVLVASAGNNVNIIGGVISNSGKDGATSITAAKDINLSSVTTASADNLVFDPKNTVSSANTRQVGSAVMGAGSVRLQAGNDITASASSAQAGTALTLVAGNNITIAAGQDTDSFAATGHSTSKGFLSKKSTTTRDTSQSTTAAGSTLGGNTVVLSAGNNLAIQGSEVIGDTAATLIAKNNLTIEAAQNSSSTTSFRSESKSGLFSNGGLSVTIGKKQNSTDQKEQGTTAAASTVGSINGNVNLIAGQTYRQVGSDILAPTGDINILAKDVQIIEARETTATQTESKTKQSGLTVAISSPVVSAIQSAQGMAQAAKNTSSGRMKLLAAGSTALNLYSNADSIGSAATALGKGDLKNAGSISLSLGSSKSQSNSNSTSNTARGSTVNAGGNVNITATGAGQASNILIQGSDIKAGNNASLTADNQINLLAAKNESTDKTTNSSSSGSIGVSLSAQGLSATASASKGKGKSDGQGTSYTNSRITAGNTASIKSGADTAIKGAVVAANQIKADIGGNLTIESLQDTNTYNSSQKSSGFSVSVPITGSGSAGGSVSASKSNINSNFQSVGEQSGLKAGDGGFQVSVANNTTLTGGVIASTDSAVTSGKNSFTTGNQLTITDVQNTASFSGKAVGGTIGAGSQLGSSGAGVGNMQGSAASTSSAGISGIAGNTAVRTGDAETGIKPIFNADTVQKDIDAQVKITTAFTQQAAKAVGDYAGKRMKEADAKAAQAADEADPDKKAALLKEAADIKETWGEGKFGRVALHTAIGALTGNVAGALGAGTSQALIPYIADAVAKLDAPLEVKQALIQIAGTAVGATVGGTSGGASALGITANNYLTHIQWEKLSEKLKSCKTPSACAQATTDAVALSVKQDAELRLACQDTSSPDCRSQLDAALDGSRTQMELIAAGKLPDNYAAGADLNAQANRLARNVIVADIKAACLTDPSCRQKQDNINGVLLLGTIGLITAPMLPSLGSAAVAWIVANPVTAMQLGIISAETAAALATGAVSPSSLAEGMFAMAAAGSIKFVGAAGGATGAGKGFVGGATIKTLAEAADSMTAQSAAQALKLQQELQAFSKVKPDTAKDAYYLANTDQSLLIANRFDMNHVLSGEINAAGRATGYHAELAADGAARIRPGSTVTQIGLAPFPRTV